MASTAIATAFHCKPCTSCSDAGGVPTIGVVATNFSTAYTFFVSNESAAGEQDAWTIDLEVAPKKSR